MGLLFEEYNPRSRRQIGNFPQAFSHVALINTGYNLSDVTRSTRSGSVPALLRSSRELDNSSASSP